MKIAFRFSQSGFTSSAHMNAVRLSIRDYWEAREFKDRQLSGDEGDLIAKIHGLNQLDWKTNTDFSALKKRFQFKNFVEGFSFINSLAVAAQRVQRYPRIWNVYNTVEVEFIQSKDGISVKDVLLAFTAEELATALKSHSVSALQDISYFQDKQFLQKWNTNYENSKVFEQDLSKST